MLTHAVMTSPEVGLTKSDLKPAFLMLASCFTDLSRQMRATGPTGAELAKEHMSKAAEYFQIVYGSNTPRDLEEQDNQRPSPLAPSGTSARATSISVSTTNKGRTTPESSHTARVRNKSGLSSDEAAQIRIMQREVQSLRDRQKHHLAQIAEAGTAKRKLEDELAEEREQRRRADQSLEDTAGELHAARRSMRHALDQCRREVEARRRAEDRAAEVRGELEHARRELSAKTREAHEKDRKARECFARLGALFARAARDELGDPMTPILSGSAWSESAAPSQAGPPLKRRRAESG